ncbi:MAG: lysophospholipase [Bacilli bacterium]|nr:lysophospholipase [Bacilli bacterium]
MAMKKFEFKNRYNDVRRGQCWEIEKPKANIMIFEGMEEYVARYDKFALELNKAGYNVYSLDTYGQGENAEHDGVGIWPKDGFHKQVDNYGELADKLLETGLPLYVFSHSMGSFMCQSFLERHPGKVTKFCICGSGGKNPILGLGHFIAKCVVHKSNWNKKAKLMNNLMFANLSAAYKSEGPLAWLSVNEENVKKYEADPLCGFGPTNGFCLSFIQGMLPLYKKQNLARVDKDISIFLIGGEGDPVTNFGKFTIALDKQYRDLGVKDVSYRIYKDMRHEILNEKNWKEVSDDVVNFFAK